MPSPIERFLYGDAADVVTPDGGVGDYSLSEIQIGDDRVSLRISSERAPYVFSWIHFRKTTSITGGISGPSDPYEATFPIAIDAFHSWQAEDESRAEIWKFALRCTHANWTWYSAWPTVEDA